ncbi:uncharacterized protein LOC117509126 isoform X2 [Thalassophryne amazonica]|uniref:uncharacterized protein LOC117509126 isoform X2 n=1 Tax=Thalassophryne amazonica TaxID=390379 RepID=UPI0014713F8C|nr:uncharacterized protein LOC117509126 isoform X2 [Thalassophryne amazonica]
MTVSAFIILLFLCMVQDLTSFENMEMMFEVMPVTLGDSVTLNCTYNCSSGFIRGCWSKTSANSVCLGKPSGSDFCTVSLHLSNVSTEDVKYNYSCYTEDKEHPQLQQETQRVVSLYFHAQTTSPSWLLHPQTDHKNASLPVEPKDAGRGEFGGIKIVAGVTIAVATVLAALAFYLCFSRNRHSRNSKGNPAVSLSGSPRSSHAAVMPAKRSSSTQCSRVTVTTPTQDDSDAEVPYADIMIPVRGISTPELTKITYLTPGAPKELWADEFRCNLQMSRSADRLHVPQPREIGRKMSTNSEYAVITYA